MKQSEVIKIEIVLTLWCMFLIVLIKGMP